MALEVKVIATINGKKIPWSEVPEADKRYIRRKTMLETKKEA